MRMRERYEEPVFDVIMFGRDVDTLSVSGDGSDEGDMSGIQNHDMNEQYIH